MKYSPDALPFWEKRRGAGPLITAEKERQRFASERAAKEAEEHVDALGFWCSTERSEWDDNGEDGNGNSRKLPCPVDQEVNKDDLPTVDHYEGVVALAWR